jgi:glycosyltransferase involved in cell wall biosynthesis
MGRIRRIHAGSAPLGEAGWFNTEFANWASANFESPLDYAHVCQNWFVTAPRNSRPADFSLQPLDAQLGTGLRLLLREPPDMVRVWHELPPGFFDVAVRGVTIRIRGLTEDPNGLHLDSVALFFGSERERKFDRKLAGPIALGPSWQEVAVAATGIDAKAEEGRLISLRFSGRGTIEVEYCRPETSQGMRTGAWVAAKAFADKVMRLRRKRRDRAPAPLVVTPSELVPARRVSPETPSPESRAGASVHTLKSVSTDQAVGEEIKELRRSIKKLSGSMDVSAAQIRRLTEVMELVLQRLDAAPPAIAPSGPAAPTPVIPVAEASLVAPSLLRAADQPVRAEAGEAAAATTKTINWVIGPPDNIGWAYGNNAKRLAGRLTNYKHVISAQAPSDVAIYFDALVAERYPVEARKSILRIGGPRPLDRLYGDDLEAMRRAFSKFDAIIALSAELYFRALRAHENVYLIPNALDLKEWHPSRRKRDEHAPFTVGFAASLKSSAEAEVKGRAIAEGAVERVGARMLLTSKGGGAQIPHDRMIKDFYSKIDVLIHPVAPGREGTSNVVMEALSLGVPVLTTQHCGFHGEFLVDGQSALVRERDESSFAEALTLVQRDERLRRRLVTEGRAFAERHHNLKTASRSYSWVISELFSRTSAADAERKTVCFAPFWEPAENFGSSRLRAKYPADFLAQNDRFEIRMGYDPVADIAIVVQMCTHDVMSKLNANQDQFVVYDVCDRYYEKPRLFKHVSPPIDSLARFHELCERADLILVPSRELKAEIAARFPDKPVKFLPEPVDYGATPRAPKEHEKKILLWYGNPDRGNFESAKPMIEHLRDKHGYTPLIVSRTSFFKKYPDFLPYCRDWSMEAMEEAFSVASLCVVAYDESEQTKSPNRFVAAMMHGVPTLVRGSPACNEILVETGQTFAIVDTLERLDHALSNLESKEFLELYVQRVQRHLNQTVGEKAITEAYSELFRNHTFKRSLFSTGPRRVAFISHNLSIGEGAPWSLFELVHGLRDRGIEPHVFAPASGPLLNQYLEASIPVEVFEPVARHSVKVLNSRYHAVSQKFTEFLKNARIEAVICNTVKAAPFAEIARRARIPSAVIVRESYTAPERFSYLDGEARLAGMTGLANAEHIVFVANTSREFWSDQPFNGPVHIIPNGISQARFAKEIDTPKLDARTQLGLPRDAVIGLCVGTINTRKGQRELVEWFATLAPEVRDRAHLVFLGAVQNVHLRDFRRVADSLPQEIQSRITVIEATPQVSLYYRAADICLLNSTSEAYPRCIVEALCFGLPVLSTRVFGVNEQVTHGEAGFLYDFGDMEAWKAHFTRLVANDEERQAMGQAASRSFWKLTGYSEMLLAYKSIISDLLDKAAAKSR